IDPTRETNYAPVEFEQTTAGTLPHSVLRFSSGAGGRSGRDPEDPGRSRDRPRAPGRRWAPYRVTAASGSETFSTLTVDFDPFLPDPSAPASTRSDRDLQHRH